MAGLAGEGEQLLVAAVCADEVGQAGGKAAGRSISARYDLERDYRNTPKIAALAKGGAFEESERRLPHEAITTRRMIWCCAEMTPACWPKVWKWPVPATMSKARSSAEPRRLEPIGHAADTWWLRFGSGS